MSEFANAAEIPRQIVALLPRLRRFARTLTRHAPDADDLVQTAVERALRHTDQWRPDTSLLSWLFGIVRNAWIDDVRARKRRAHLFLAEEAGHHVGESPMNRADDLYSIQAAMERLPDEQRLAVGLVLVEGLSYKEAARLMDVPVGTLTSRLARGRLALESMLSATPAIAFGSNSRSLE
jgi:RNA polymerase sigma-70 factor, ECF subfamily